MADAWVENMFRLRRLFTQLERTLFKMKYFLSNISEIFDYVLTNKVWYSCNGNAMRTPKSLVPCGVRCKRNEEDNRKYVMFYRWRLSKWGLALTIDLVTSLDVFDSNSIFNTVQIILPSKFQAISHNSQSHLYVVYFCFTFHISLETADKMNVRFSEINSKQRFWSNN